MGRGLERLRRSRGLVRGLERRASSNDFLAGRGGRILFFSGWACCTALVVCEGVGESDVRDLIIRLTFGQVNWVLPIEHEP